MYVKKSIRERVLSRVKKQGDHLLWQGPRYRQGPGYGYLRFEGKQQQAHRVVYQIVTGRKIRPQDVLWNLCGSPHCVNPDHWKIYKGERSKYAQRVA